MEFQWTVSILECSFLYTLEYVLCWTYKIYTAGFRTLIYIMDPSQPYFILFITTNLDHIMLFWKDWYNYVWCFQWYTLSVIYNPWLWTDLELFDVDTASIFLLVEKLYTLSYGRHLQPQGYHYMDVLWDSLNLEHTCNP